MINASTSTYDRNGMKVCIKREVLRGKMQFAYVKARIFATHEDTVHHGNTDISCAVPPLEKGKSISRFILRNSICISKTCAAFDYFA